MRPDNPVGLISPCTYQETERGHSLCRVRRSRMIGMPPAWHIPVIMTGSLWNKSNAQDKALCGPNRGSPGPFGHYIAKEFPFPKTAKSERSFPLLAWCSSFMARVYHMTRMTDCYMSLSTAQHDLLSRSATPIKIYLPEPTNEDIVQKPLHHLQQPYGDLTTAEMRRVDIICSRLFDITSAEERGSCKQLVACILSGKTQAFPELRSNTHTCRRCCSTKPASPPPAGSSIPPWA